MTMPVVWKLENKVCDAYLTKNRESSELHGHRHFLMTFITRGEGIQTINGKDFPFHQNDFFILSPADFHKNTIPSGASFDYYGVKFRYELLDERLSGYFSVNRFPVCIHFSEEEAVTVCRLFETLCREANSRTERIAGNVYQQTLIEQLFILAVRHLPPRKEEEDAFFLNRTLGFAYSHFTEPVSVTDAATYAGYTTNYFNTRFKKETGSSFGDFLRQLRITYAENLLSSCNTPVTEIAMEAGFSSLSHFSHYFREKNGMSPMDYRKNNQTRK